MSNDTAAFRSLLIYAICLPLAIFLGYLVADPLDRTSQVMVGLVLFLMALPLFFRWYHPWLIAVWNSSLLFMFLPGQLAGWTVMAIIGFGVAMGHYIINRDRHFLEARGISMSLIFLAVVVAVTAKCRGGIGLHVLGDETIGSKRYFLIWVAIMGYFALTSQAVPVAKRKFMTFLFIVSGATAILSDMAGILGGPLRFLAIFFPITDSSTYLTQHSLGYETVERYGGLGGGCLAIALAMLAYYGVEGVLSLRKLWRPVLFFSALFLMTFGGFRGLLIFSIMVCALVFYFEGLLRSRLMPIALLGLLLAGGLVLPFAEHLPPQFQRCLAFLPIKLDPMVKANAESSSDWRIEMWESLLPDIPKYFWLGKGLGIDVDELASYYEFGSNQVGGQVGGGLAVAGDYHNGPLSLIIQFGVWGAIGFLWFLAASMKVLWANYKYGDPEIKRMNTFLVAYFIAKIIMFFLVFGSFYSDMMIFTGIMGFSVSLNAGVAKPVPVERPKVAFQRFRPLPVAATAG